MSSVLSASLSAQLSRADALTLERYGRDIIQDSVGLIAETVFCSVYGIFFAFAVYSIMRRRLRSRGSVIMLFIVVYLYATSVVQWALRLASTFRNIHYLLMVPDTPIPDRAHVADEGTIALYPPEEALWVLNMVIGDAVVIWRVWAIYQQRMLAILIPCILLLVSFVFGIMDITCSSYHGPLPGDEQVCPQVSLISWVFSVATNVACTVFIGFKAWQHHRTLRELNILGKSQMTSTEKILSLLVESGFIFSLLWLSMVIVYIHEPRTSPSFYPFLIFEALGYQISGMYPTLIIVIVNFQRTIWEDSPSFTGNGPGAKTLELEFSINRSGSSNTFHTPRGVDIHLDTVFDKNVQPEP